MDNEANRPAVLDRVSETQIQELERHYTDENRHEWDVLTDSYGWTRDEAKQVWDWFGLDPEKKR